MTIKSVIKKEETIEKEISLPYFCKYENYWMKILDEERLLQVYWNNEKSNSIRLSAIWLNNTEVSQSVECTEDEFNEMYHKALFEIGKYVPAPDVPKELIEPNY